MTYAFRPDDPSVESALRRIARAEASAAIDAARGEGELGPRVHAMRKSVKKLRGLLRLVRPVCREAREENVALRDMGRGLSALRDAAVQLATAESVTEGMEASRRDALLAPFRATAAGHHEASAEDLAAFAATMEALRGRVGTWRVKADGWDALAPGLEATWAAARAALREARRDPSGEAVHDWRKRAKDHWYQARLLQGIWPELMEAHVGAADALGEALGQLHDLDVLAGRLGELALPEALRDEAGARAAARRASLWDEAEARGRRLFAEKPRALSRRWGHWWDLREAPAGQAEAG